MRAADRRAAGCTRRSFLETAGAGVAAGAWTHLTGCTRSPATGPVVPAVEGAPGVELLSTPAVPDYSRDLTNHLVRLTREARARRQKIVGGLASRDQVLARQQSVVKELWGMLGGPFEKTPLNPRITGVLERPGYRIEKLVFESRPRLYVTANVYVPDRSGRRPAILSPLGHSLTGKAWHTYQKVCANLARKGYVVLTYDPFGQGERIEYPGARPGLTALGGGGTSEHEYAGRRLILLGANFGSFRAWDGIRAIDYLVTRPDVDPERLGCCGQSGGATLTQFLAALDPRLRAAVVSQGNTENVAHDDVEPPGSADDAEQNIVPGLAHGIDRADLLLGFAPKPLLMTVTLHDAGHTYSPEYVDSGLDLLQEYRRVYGLFDAPDRVSLVATTQQHGYIREMRRATYAWFNRWLDVTDGDDEEASLAFERDEVLYVTPTGFVSSSFGGETALSLTRRMAETVPAPANLEPGEVRARIRRVLAIGESAVPVAHVQYARIQKSNYRAEQFDVTTEEDIRVPGWLLEPDDVNERTPTVFYLGEGAAWGAVAEESVPERLCRVGRCRVVVIDVRGRGDTAIGYPSRGRHYFPNRITNEAYLTWFTLLLGRPLIGGQVHDVLAVLTYLRSRLQPAGPGVSLVGDGAHGVIALFAAALDPAVRSVAVRQAITDYRSLATAERYTQPFGIYAYGVLKAFDLPDVAGAVAPRRVQLIDPVNPLGGPADGRVVDMYKGRTNVSIAVLEAGADLVPHLAAWLAG